MPLDSAKWLLLATAFTAQWHICEITVFTKTCHMAWRHNKWKASIPAWVKATRMASKSCWSVMLYHCTTPTCSLCNYVLNFPKKKHIETQKPLNWEGSHTCSSSACSPHVKRTPSPHKHTLCLQPVRQQTTELCNALLAFGES